MRHSISALAASAAFVIALLAGQQASQAAPADCLAAPSGAAPNGQHWYYHLDHASKRKCWYLRALGAAAATPGSAPSPRADSATPPAAVTTQGAASAGGVATAEPAEHAMPAPTPSGAWPQAGRPALDSVPAPGVGDISPPPSAAQPVNTRTTAPHQPVLPANAAPGAQNAAVAAAVVADPPVRHASMKERTAAPSQTPAAAPAAGMKSATSIAQNLLIMLLAALMAGGVFAVFAVVRGRKRGGIGRAAGGPRFGSRPEQEAGLWLKWPRRETGMEPAAPIQNSLIPQQASVTRRSAPHH